MFALIPVYSFAYNQTIFFTFYLTLYSKKKSHFFLINSKKKTLIIDRLL